MRDARPYPGQRAVASNLRRLLAGERRRTPRVQDAYSLRCIPQILGGVADALDDLERRLLIEVNAASDNPLVFAETGDVVAAGNFHGQSLALALDLFGNAVATTSPVSAKTSGLSEAAFTSIRSRRSRSSSASATPRGSAEVRVPHPAARGCAGAPPARRRRRLDATARWPG